MKQNQLGHKATLIPQQSSTFTLTEMMRKMGVNRRLVNLLTHTHAL
jgi:hypothetical protein